nr:serine/threonine-protein kinase STY13-like [Solanum lycopersicum]
MQEVSIWCNLQHSNIAEFIGAIKKTNVSKIKIKCKKCANVLSTNGYCCIVVEYVGGGTLQSYLYKHTILKKKLPLDTTIQVALDVAKGLNYIHSNKIVHRDVKTKNLLVDKNGRVKIIDFGISSKFYSPMMVGTSGTMGYMAPEVLSGSSYDHKCDVYSFAICLWEMYACLFPYPQHISHSKISHQIYKYRRPEILKSCPTALSDIMKKCWDVNPQNRPEMKEVMQMLLAIKTRRQQQQL